MIYVISIEKYFSVFFFNLLARINLLCVLIFLRVYINVSVGKVQGYANKFTKPKHYSLAKIWGLTYSTKQWSGGEHGDKQKHAHKPDVDCNDWMLCKGIIAIFYINPH